MNADRAGQTGGLAEMQGRGDAGTQGCRDVGGRRRTVDVIRERADTPGPNPKQEISN